MPRDPRCNHANKTVRVSTHVNLEAAYNRDEPHASVWTCERPECLADAKRWVRESVPSREPVVVPLRDDRFTTGVDTAPGG
jgi:hypothetical protein